jgi:hypothetical protein
MSELAFEGRLNSNERMLECQALSSKKYGKNGPKAETLSPAIETHFKKNFH